MLPPAALVVLNGLFVAAEFALVSVRKTRIEELAARGVKGSRSVLKALEQMSDAIAATARGRALTIAANRRPEPLSLNSISCQPPAGGR